VKHAGVAVSRARARVDADEPGGRRKRICIVVAAELTVRAFLLDHLRALSAGHDVTVVANFDDMALLERAHISAEAVRVPIERKISIVRDTGALLRLFRLFRSRRFDAIHTITPKAGLLGMIAGALAGVPVRTHTFTGQTWATAAGPSRMLLKTVDRVLAAFATGLLADSASQRDFLVAEGIVGAGRIGVLGPGSISGVDLGRFRPDEEARAAVRAELHVPAGAFVFLFIGRLNTDKGVLELAEAFARLARGTPGTHLLVVGPDEEQMRPRMEVILGAMAARTAFVEFTPRPERFMAAADVLCLPSYREGFGSVIIEAAAVGVPAIASRIYGVVDAIEDGETGLFHDPRDVDGLVAAMERLVGDPALVKKLADGARARAAAEFSKERITREMVGFYSTALRRGTNSDRREGNRR
jgi:glycosyltransferase involved in cell wall biosynthesis